MKYVHARVLDPYTGGMSMFKAEGGAIRERGVVIEDTVVEPDQDRCVTLAVHN